MAASLDPFFELGLDPACVLRAGQISRVSAAFAQVVGFGPTILRGRTFVQLCIADDQAKAAAALDALEDDGGIACFEARFDGPEGVRRIGWRAARHGPHTYLSGRDITHATQELPTVDRSERALETFLECLPAGVLISRGGRVVYANPSLVNALGFDSGASICALSSPRSIGHPGDLAVLRRVIALNDAVSPLSTMSELRLRGPDGKYRQFEAVSAVVPYGGVVSLVALFRDVTAGAEQRHQQRHADRLATVGTLAAGVAHEINNPLTYILANLELSLEIIAEASLPSADREELVELVGDALDGAGRVSRIVASLSSFGRLSDGVATTVSLQVCVDAALRLTERRVLSRARLSVEVPEEARVHVIEAEMVQVLVNLLLNAMQAIPKQSAARDHLIEIRAVGAGAEIHLTVTDTGEGLPPGDTDGIFQPFVTTRRGTGAGLGLSVCRRIVTGWGGRISAERLGTGTRLRIVLPRSDTEAVPWWRGSSAPRPVAPVTICAPRVLVIDDEPRVGEIVQRILGEAAVYMRSPREAVQRALSEPFDAIVCDVVMPEMSGVEVLGTLKAQGHPLAERIVFVTGGILCREDQRALANSGLPLLFKPISSDALRQAVRDLVGEG